MPVDPRSKTEMPVVDRPKMTPSQTTATPSPTPSTSSGPMAPFGPYMMQPGRPWPNPYDDDVLIAGDLSQLYRDLLRYWDDKSPGSGGRLQYALQQPQQPVHAQTAVIMPGSAPSPTTSGTPPPMTATPRPGDKA